MNVLVPFYICGLLLLTLLTSCQSDQHPSVYLAFTPQAVVIDDKQTIYYELDVVNTLNDSIVITNLEIHGADRLLLSEEGTSLQRLAATVTLGPGDTTTFYIELVAEGEDETIQLSHRFRANALRDGGITPITFQSDVETNLIQPVVIGAPFADGTWAAVNDPSWPRGHRRVRFPGDSKEFLPGRFAIDFIQLDSSGRYAEGDENQITNWLGYGHEVLAVGAGIVVAARNDFAEMSTLDKHPHYPAEQATGNYIAMEIAPSVIVFYEHLKPGSIRVSKGQRISKGDVIAQLGFTGQSTGPHLHLHIANDSAPLLSEGIAFVFEEFESLGRYDDFSMFGKARWKDEPVSTRRGERPGVNVVVGFSSRFPVPSSRGLRRQ